MSLALGSPIRILLILQRHWTSICHGGVGGTSHCSLSHAWNSSGGWPSLTPRDIEGDGRCRVAADVFRTRHCVDRVATASRFWRFTRSWARDHNQGELLSTNSGHILCLQLIATILMSVEGSSLWAYGKISRNGRPRVGIKLLRMKTDL